MDMGAFRRHVRQALRALKTPVRSSSHHVHPTYTEAELLLRADEFNQNAERHWRKIASEPGAREHVLNKPLSTVRDTAGIFYRLGLVLQELDLGIGMTVVDFGAGSCWFSSLMNRLRLRTISVDVSPTALNFGREMFHTDARHHMELDPQFVTYSGHAIAIPDESVDRVVCFDSFHHVPNQAEVLREFYRILKPGGRLVMGEPGEGHAHSDQSAFETETHGVLENDIHLDDLAAIAKGIGFHSPRLKPFPDPASITFSLDQHVRFMAGDDGVYPIEAVRESLRHSIILSLFKGSSAPDSRNPSVLKAEIKALELTPRPDGAGATVKVRVRNIGDTKWLHEESILGGFVVLGAHLVNSRREPVGRGFRRVYLKEDVEPGGSVDLEMRLPNLDPQGEYQVQLDMVDERVAWFEQCGSQKLTLDQRFDLGTGHRPGFLFATLALLSPKVDDSRPKVPAGAPLSVTLELLNTGDTKWVAGPPGVRGSICLGVEVCDEHGALLVRDHERFALPNDVQAGERIEFTFTCHAPATAGRHRLRFDLVNEGIDWFDQYGVAPVSFAVETV